MALIDITGNRYNKLVAVRFVESKPGGAHWEFRCDCGNLKITSANSVKRGDTQSCGCHRSETSRRLNTKHGQSQKHDGAASSRLYGIWAQMKRRCDLPSVESYPRYGGRGIRVCKEWSESFESFERWALTNGYNDNLTIDRRDNDGNYEPGNCRWTDRKGQANNRSSNRIVEYLGMKMTLAELAESSGVKPATLALRLDDGMDPERAVRTGRRHLW